MFYIPKQDDGLLDYFAGAWHFSRTILDDKTDIDAHVNGEASLRREGVSLLYAEQGVMEYGAYHGQVTQHYIYDFEAPGRASVRFSDGRLFHELDLSTGADSVTHLCPPDTYAGRYELLEDAKWTLNWKISGPRKKLNISTRYWRP